MTDIKVPELGYEERVLNNGRLVERKICLFGRHTPADVTAIILNAEQGLCQCSVEVEHEPDPYGGMGFQYIIVYGRREGSQ